MIQRIQTIYWLLIGVFFILMIPFDWMSLVVSDGDYVFSADGITKGADSVIAGWPLMLYLIGMAAFNFVIIFLYKKRILQSKLSVISLIMSLGFYALMLMYRYMSFEGDVQSANYCWPLILPLINAILSFMGWRAAINDEAYVRSLDRLR